MLAEQIGEMLITRLQEEMMKVRPKGWGNKSGNSIATGKLKNSLNYQVIEDADGFKINIVSLGYLQYLNDGRKPGKPPKVKIIEEWVRTKKLTDAKKTKQLAYAITISIAKKGIKKTGIIQDAIESIWSEIVEKIGIMNAQVVEETIKIDLDTILPKKTIIKL